MCGLPSARSVKDGHNIAIQGGYMQEIAARGDGMPYSAAHGNVWQRYAITVAARGAVLTRYRSVSECNGSGCALINRQIEQVVSRRKHTLVLAMSSR